MIWALVLALTLIATPAAAEFTANEKTNVRSLILGVNLIRSGLQDQIAAESLSGYATAWQAVVDCHDALGYLFGTQIKQGEQARSKLAATPRSGWLALAWKSLDRCIAGLDSAQAQAWAATNKYAQARITIAAFPRGGSGALRPGPPAPFAATPALYQNPKPASHPHVIGPHGDYDFAQENLWFAIKYAHDSLYIFGSRYLCDAANYEGLIMGALANVRYPGGETSDGFDSTVVDDVSNVLWLQKFALEDTAVKYLATTMNEYQAATGSAQAALHAVTKHNDSWKNLDRAIRNTMCINGRVNCDRTPH